MRTQQFFFIIFYFYFNLLQLIGYKAECLRINGSTVGRRLDIPALSNVHKRVFAFFIILVGYKRVYDNTKPLLKILYIVLGKKNTMFKTNICSYETAKWYNFPTQIIASNLACCIQRRVLECFYNIYYVNSLQLWNVDSVKYWVRDLMLLIDIINILLC